MPAAFDPRELERTEERLFALRAASRKYDVPVDDLPALQARMTADLAAIWMRAKRALRRSRRGQSRGGRLSSTAAGALSPARQHGRAGSRRPSTRNSPPLKLERARFITQIDTDDDGARAPDGIDRVEFWVQTNPAPGRGR